MKNEMAEAIARKMEEHAETIAWYVKTGHKTFDEAVAEKREASCMGPKPWAQIESMAQQKIAAAN